MASNLMAKGTQISKSFHGLRVGADIPEAVTVKVLIGWAQHAAKADVIVAGVDIAFAACAHHVTGAILVGAEE